MLLSDAYPRPDFYRESLNWESLNKPWSFLFDDDDIGVTSHWPRDGLPLSVTTQGSLENLNLAVASENKNESESITAKIAGNTQKLREGNLSLQHKKDSKTYKKRGILVPYVFQCPASGVNERAVHEVFWYERSIGDIRTAEEKAKGHRLLLRFGAVDYESRVWVDAEFVGGHRGGHVPFDIDITDTVDANPSENHRITVRIYDGAYDLTQPRGKQYWGAKPESIFYTPSSGIWQTVWLESVPVARIGDSSHGTVLRNNDIEKGELHARVAILGRKTDEAYSVEIEATFNGNHVRTERKPVPNDDGSVEIDINLRLPNSSDSVSKSKGSRDGLMLWSPENPQLYTLHIRLFDSTGTPVDAITTITGMRSLSWAQGDSIFRLNGYPLFQMLNLDQGYWPETFMTPPSSQALKTDIELAKKMGFNGCRKHQKVEDPRFLYWADKLGYLVWGEMANAYRFSLEYVERFNQEWAEAVKRDINHPCVVTWTPVNESWAYTDLANSVEQRNHIRALYDLTKSLDPTRPVNDNCGWEHVCPDFTSFHDYSDAAALAKTCSSLDGILGPKANRPMFVKPIPGQDPGCEHKPGAVVICTEFGGVNIARKENADDDSEWGYTTAADPEDLLRRVENLVNAVVDGGLCSGFVWTQLTDIEQETNGLYSFDRQEKLDSEKVKAVMQRAAQEYLDGVGRIPLDRQPTV